MTRIGDAVTADPERMTGRAQGYLGVALARHAVIAWYCLFAPEYLASRPFGPISKVLPFAAWGVAFTLVAVVCLWAALTRSEVAARIGLISSAILTAVWACGFAAAVFGDLTTSPAGVIGFTSLALKDLIVCRTPLRSPFEPITRRLLGEA